MANKKHTRKPHASVRVEKFKPKKVVHKTMKPETQKALLAGAGVLVIIIACFFIFRLDGSLKLNADGTAATREGTWVVANMGTSSNPKAFESARVTTPEGYELDETWTSTPPAVQLHYLPTDPESKIKAVTYMGSSTPLDKILTSVMTSSEGYYPGGVNDAGKRTIAGLECNCIYIEYINEEALAAAKESDAASGEDTTMFAILQQLAIYTRGMNNSTLITVLQADVDSAEDFIPVDDLYAAAEVAMSNVHFSAE